VVGRLFGGVGWSLLLGFLAGVCTYVVAALVNLLFGPVHYTNVGLVAHAGMALIYGIGGAIIIGAALFISYLVFFRGRVSGRSLWPFALVAFVAQCLEIGIVEAFAIRESSALAWPIAYQLMPWNIGIFAPVGNWEGRPDAAFFWFSGAIAAFASAAWMTRGES